MTTSMPLDRAIPRQCKDIPDRPILEFLLSHKGKWCNWYFDNERDVHLSMPEGTPEKLVLAKMRMLIRRGVVTGCPCGCRGDFEITEKGEAMLKAEGIDVSRLEEADCLGLVGSPTKAFVDRERGVVVQVWDNATPGCNGTPWAGTLRVSIKHTRAKTPQQVMSRGFAKPITWDDMQAIKDRFWPERIAIEIFPPKESIVDVADMRWMWVLPPGAVLPFNLKKESEDRLVS